MLTSALRALVKRPKQSNDSIFVTFDFITPSSMTQTHLISTNYQIASSSQQPLIIKSKIISHCNSPSIPPNHFPTMKP